MTSKLEDAYLRLFGRDVWIGKRRLKFARFHVTDVAALEDRPGAPARVTFAPDDEDARQIRMDLLDERE